MKAKKAKQQTDKEILDIKKMQMHLQKEEIQVQRFEAETRRMEAQNYANVLNNLLKNNN